MAWYAHRLKFGGIWSIFSAPAGPHMGRAATARGFEWQQTRLSAADAEQLERRRLELEQERFQSVEQVNAAAKKLKTLRGERDAVERQRAALLSARSIEHVQRELAEVQAQTGRGGRRQQFRSMRALRTGDYPTRASDFLAQFTNGDLVRLALSLGEGLPRMRGESRRCDDRGRAIEWVADAIRFILSLCLTLLSAAARKGVWLPLVLDEPFERLDVRVGRPALVAVLDVFCRQGHQVFVFTRKQDATERLASVRAGGAQHRHAAAVAG